MKAQVYRLQLVKEKSFDYSVRTLRVQNSETAQSIINGVFDANNQPEEHVYCLALDTAGHIAGLFEVSHGVVNGSYISPKEIIKRVLLCGGWRVIIAHNHPSGIPEPSQTDIDSTHKLKEACTLMDMELVDHIIIGDDSYYSFKEHGLI